jgi:hypothetical protein
MKMHAHQQSLGGRKAFSGANVVPPAARPASSKRANGRQMITVSAVAEAQLSAAELRGGSDCGLKIAFYAGSATNWARIQEQR